MFIINTKLKINRYMVCLDLEMGEIKAHAKIPTNSVTALVLAKVNFVDYRNIDMFHLMLDVAYLKSNSLIYNLKKIYEVDLTAARKYYQKHLQQFKSHIKVQGQRITGDPP